MPGRKTEIPDTIKRSPAKAQRTWREAHDSAVQTYGEGEHAHRVAYSALKHSFEKVEDHWEPKDHRGPSDPQAKQGGRAALERPRRTYGGLDVEGQTRDQLYERARGLGVKGASGMRKAELADAIARKQR
jgi:cation transport regulator ChaB